MSDVKRKIDFKDVSLPDIKFIVLAINIISMNPWWPTFKTMVLLTQYIYHVWIQLLQEVKRNIFHIRLYFSQLKNIWELAGSHL